MNLLELHDAATEGPWDVIPYSCAAVTRRGDHTDILIICTHLPEPQGKKKAYICVENARLVAVLKNATPNIIALMEAAEKSKDMTVRKALATLRKGLDANITEVLKVGEEEFRKDIIEKPGHRVKTVEDKLSDPLLGKAEKRRLRRQLRKQRRAERDASGVRADDDGDDSEDEGAE